MAEQITDIADMPRGGPDASWLDRLLETDCPEYLDRDDVDDNVKRSVVRALQRTGEILGYHERFAMLVLDEVARVPDPAILELGAGHGELSRKILEHHPSARVTVSDVDPTSVAAIAASELGRDPRVTVRTVDASAIDAPDGSFDLAVFAMSFHHLPPTLAAQVISEGTRVAHTLMIIDFPRPPSLLHIARLAMMAPLAPFVPLLHDGFISSLRSYSPSALRALALHADPAIEVAVRSELLGPQVSIARRGS